MKSHSKKVNSFSFLSVLIVPKRKSQLGGSLLLTPPPFFFLNKEQISSLETLISNTR